MIIYVSNACLSRPTPLQLLPRPLDEGTVLGQVGRYVFGEGVLEEGEAGDSCVDLLGGDLLGEHPKSMFLLACPARLAEGVGLLGNVELRGLPFPGLVGEDLSLLELPLQAPLVKLLQPLHPLLQAEYPPLLLPLLPSLLLRVSEVVELLAGTGGVCFLSQLLLEILVEILRVTI